MIKEIDLCDECEICLEVCPIYDETGNELFSPIGRLKTAKSIFNGGEVSAQMVESMYNCPECGRCEVVCPNEIKVSEIVDSARIELVKRGFAPLEGQKRIIKGIEELGNSVNGDPAKRLEWLPAEALESEVFEEKETDTLLYLGCLPSYLVKDCAESSYLALKHAGVDFMILKEEGCCGVYPYDAGILDLAEKIFEKNASRFEKLGIKRVITPCAGCYRCFKRYYPEVLGEINFEVYHVVEILDEQIKKGELKGKKEKLTLTYHDPCRLGRKEGLYDEPRRILKECGVEIKEIEENRKDGLCCGAGAGVRSLYRNLSREVATNVLNEAPSATIVTSCPFCAFNLRYAARKKEIDREILYITDIVRDCME